jgi:hypothetical protein
VISSYAVSPIVAAKLRFRLRAFAVSLDSAAAAAADTVQRASRSRGIGASIGYNVHGRRERIGI